MASPLQPSDLPMSSGSPSIDSPSSPIVTPDSPDKVVDSIPTQEEVVELQAVAKDFPNLMKFSSTPAMLDLCITDALMPSPRFMQKMTQDEHIYSPPSSIQFADELLLQTGTHILPVSESQQPVQQAVVTETIAPKAADSSLQIGNSPQIPTLPKGAWALPLKSSSFSGFQKAETNHSVLSTNEHWPALSKHQPKRNQHPPLAPSLPLKLGEKLIDVLIPASPVFKASQEYPWAAKMRSICNLRRVTTPVFMEDGTPKVSIPSHVLLEGLENQKEFVVGQFFRCAAPSGGHIHGVVSRIWGRKCRISARKLGESSYLFHIPDEATRKWVIQRGLWHVDDCLMFVSAWSPSPTISLPEISTIPVWLTLKNIPYQLYSIKGIDWIASAIGEPMLTSKPWLDPTQIGEAKILVEVKLDKQFPLKVALEDESGSITMVDVVYSWLPSKCSSCGQLGHKSSYCLGLGLQSVPIAGKVDGDLSCSEPAIGSELTTEPAASLNANTSSSTVTNADSVSVLVNSTTPISHVLPSAGLNASISLRPEILLGSSSLTNLVSTPDSTTNDVETLTSSVLTTPKTTSISAKVSTIAESVAPISNQINVVDTSHLTPIAISPTEVELVSPEAGKSLQSPLIFNIEGNVYKNEALEGRYMRERVNNPFALLDESEPLESFQDVESSASQKTQRGRTIKPTQKVQEMQWNLVGGRGSRGRGGRGGRGNTG